MKSSVKLEIKPVIAHWLYLPHWACCTVDAPGLTVLLKRQHPPHPNEALHIARRCGFDHDQSNTLWQLICEDFQHRWKSFNPQRITVEVLAPKDSMPSATDWAALIFGLYFGLNVLENQPFTLQQIERQAIHLAHHFSPEEALAVAARCHGGLVANTLSEPLPYRKIYTTVGWYFVLLPYSATAPPTRPNPQDNAALVSSFLLGALTGDWHLIQSALQHSSADLNLESHLPPLASIQNNSHFMGYHYDSRQGCLIFLFNNKGVADEFLQALAHNPSLQPFSRVVTLHPRGYEVY